MLHKNETLFFIYLYIQKFGAERKTILRRHKKYDVALKVIWC